MNQTQPTATALQLDVLRAPLALLRLPPGSPTPTWTWDACTFLSITRTPTELSIVCDADVVPADVSAERSYRAFRVKGPLPLHLVGILAALTAPLAAAAVPVFTIATYDTDYLLIRDADLPRARAALTGAGHTVLTGSATGD